tara:strand:+ start:169 stop:801 length:633 start_codon:yes stop_codon:yes gene_type:complete
MISKRIKEKGILSKLLEKGIKIFIKKECNKVGEIKIDIIASSIQIIKGLIQEVHIKAKDINYKDLLFDEIELEANEVKLILKIKDKELNINNNIIIKFTISLSETSLKKILLSNNWKWIGDLISKEILNKNKLEDLKIKDNQILIKTSKKSNNINLGEIIDITVENGKLFLENKAYNKSIRIPLEDKVCIKNINIQNNLINIFASSSISF